MSTVTGISAIEQWTDQETDDAILGAGLGTYPWWQGWDRYGNGVTIGWYDPDFGGPLQRTWVTWEQLRLAAMAIARGEHGMNGTITEAILNDDLDADAADCVLQLAVLGEIRWS